MVHLWNVIICIDEFIRQNTSWIFFFLFCVYLALFMTELCLYSCCCMLQFLQATRILMECDMGARY
jgi:hypothetical protein